MKKDTYVKITKYSQCLAPLLESADPSKYKHGEENFGVSLPVDYWVEGTLINDIREGEPIQMHRKIRNGIKMEGIFQTSPVITIKNGTVAVTLNSQYVIEEK
jgi:hypothetical protein